MTQPIDHVAPGFAPRHILLVILKMIDLFKQDRKICGYNFYIGPVAQSVEQRIENPCVGGSIPPQATKLKFHRRDRIFLITTVIIMRE